MSELGIYAFREQPHVRKPAKLTDRGTRSHFSARFVSHVNEIDAVAWANIREDAYAFMDEIRQKRLFQVHRGILQARFEEIAQALAIHRPPDRLRIADGDMDPLLVDFILMPEVRALCEDPNIVSLGIARSPVQDIHAIFDALTRDWKRKQEIALIAMLTSVLPELVGVAGSPLTLAIAAFSCTHCDRATPLRWPELLSHPCTRASWLPSWEGGAFVDALHDYSSSQRAPLSLKFLKVDLRVVRNLSAVVRACDLDPLRTTQKQLDKVKKRLVCVECVSERDDGIKVEVFDWLRAVSLKRSFTSDLETD